MGAASLSVYLAHWKAAYLLVDAGEPRYIRDPYTVKGSERHYFARRILGSVVDSNAVKALSFET